MIRSIELDHGLVFSLEHDLFGKPASTFPDHALKRSRPSRAPLVPSSRRRYAPSRRCRDNRCERQVDFGGTTIHFVRPARMAKMAPPTQPPMTWPTSAPASTLPAVLASAGITWARSCTPTTPPIAPAIVLPTAPSVQFLSVAPAA